MSGHIETESTFTSSRWNQIVEAFFDATGLSVSIASDDGDCMSRSVQCSLCGLVSGGETVGDCSCLDEETVAHLGCEPKRVTCRGGFPVYGTAIQDDVHLVVGGFFSSTRERKRAFQSLLGRGFGEDEARKAVRDVPLLAHKQVESFASMVSSQGSAVLESNAKPTQATSVYHGAKSTSSTSMDKLQRAATEAICLGEFARATGAAGDILELQPLVLSLLARSFPHAVVGVTLSGWRSDSAAIVMVEGVSEDDVAYVVMEATGRDMVTSPFESLLCSPPTGEPTTESDDAGWSLLSAEIIARDMMAGYLFVACRGDSCYHEEDRQLLQQFADHSAIAFERASVFEHMRSDYSRALAALSVTLDASEGVSRGHSDRVMDYAMLVGREVGLPTEQIEMLRFAGLLHDIGKTGISEEILLKPTSLTEEEAARVRLHAERGATLVEQVEFLNELAPIIMHHHERWDGKGYPMQLRGDDTPIMARILGIADSYDAMTSERPYRARLSHTAARAEMEAGAGTQFDPLLVAALFEALDRRALGGSTGVLMQHRAGEDMLPA